LRRIWCEGPRVLLVYDGGSFATCHYLAVELGRRCDHECCGWPRTGNRKAVRVIPRHEDEGARPGGPAVRGLLIATSLELVLPSLPLPRQQMRLAPGDQECVSCANNSRVDLPARERSYLGPRWRVATHPARRCPAGWCLSRAVIPSRSMTRLPMKPRIWDLCSEPSARRCGMWSAAARPTSRCSPKWKAFSTFTSTSSSPPARPGGGRSRQLSVIWALPFLAVRCPRQGRPLGSSTRATSGTPRGEAP